MLLLDAVEHPETKQGVAQMSRSEFTANVDLSESQKEHRASPEMVELVARNRAERAKAAKGRRTAISAIIVIALVSTTALWARSIVADVQGWKSTHAGTYESRLEAVGW